MGRRYGNCEKCIVIVWSGGVEWYDQNSNRSTGSPSCKGCSNCHFIRLWTERNGDNLGPVMWSYRRFLRHRSYDGWVISVSTAGKVSTYGVVVYWNFTDVMWIAVESFEVLCFGIRSFTKKTLVHLSSYPYRSEALDSITLSKSYGGRAVEVEL